MTTPLVTKSVTRCPQLESHVRAARLLKPETASAPPSPSSSSNACAPPPTTPTMLMNIIYVMRRGPPQPQTSGATTNAETSSSLQVLLGHKARGHGSGRWNGFGGKVDLQHDVSIAASAVRELHEECGLKCSSEVKLMHRGVLFFYYPCVNKLMEVHVFLAKEEDCLGQVVESEEMNPISWFERVAIPLDKMWADNPYWLPMLLEAEEKGKPMFIAGAFLFEPGMKEIHALHVDLTLSKATLETQYRSPYEPL